LGSWGASTIRAILYNERYIGVWRFKENVGNLIQLYQRL